MTGWDTTVDDQGGGLRDDLAPALDGGKIVESSGFVDPKTIGLHDGGTIALLVRVQVRDQPGVLHALTRVIFEHRANITYVDIGDRRQRRIATYFELSEVEDVDALVRDLEALPIVREVERAPSFGRIYGKRIIVIGGGAQVGQVVLGAVSEADRHNIRGERISVDTIPLVGEDDLAGAVRAVARLPRAVALVMAGSIMGGEVARAVREQGIVVVSLNMAGSVPDEADLVVTDPVQAGVMTVMLVARTAKFDIRRQRGRRY
jgi:energy-converting hydrogenase B subunit Q